MTFAFRAFRVSSRLLVALVVLACSTAGNPTGSPNPTLPAGSSPPATAGTGSPPPSEAIPTLSADVDDVRLHGTFTGHQDDPASTSDATFDVVVIWHRPNEIHDMLNFQFESGSFTFSTSVTGVCGGTRTEGGPLEFWSEGNQSLIYGDPQDRSQTLHISLIDNRLEQGGLVFAEAVHFDIPSGAAECQPPYASYGYISNCSLEFRLATLDTLKTEASCAEGGTSWTGQLVEQ